MSASSCSTLISHTRASVACAPCTPLLSSGARRAHTPCLLGQSYESFGDATCRPQCCARGPAAPAMDPRASKRPRVAPSPLEDVVAVWEASRQAGGGSARALAESARSAARAIPARVLAARLLPAAVAAAPPSQQRVAADEGAKGAAAARAAVRTRSDRASTRVLGQVLARLAAAGGPSAGAAAADELLNGGDEAATQLDQVLRQGGDGALGAAARVVEAACGAGEKVRHAPGPPHPRCPLVLRRPSALLRSPPLLAAGCDALGVGRSARLTRPPAGASCDRRGRRLGAARRARRQGRLEQHGEGARCARGARGRQSAIRGGGQARERHGGVAQGHRHSAALLGGVAGTRAQGSREAGDAGGGRRGVAGGGRRAARGARGCGRHCQREAGVGCAGGAGRATYTACGGGYAAGGAWLYAG